MGDHFGQLVRDALTELPDFVQASLADNVAVLISDDGAKCGYYGYYRGGAVGYGGDYNHTIVIYRDTLVRDFGRDPDELRRAVATTVRHELAHHLGASERRVAELGLWPERQPPSDRHAPSLPGSRSAVDTYAGYCSRREAVATRINGHSEDAG